MSETKAKKIDARQRLAFALAGGTVLRTLELADGRLRYGQFGKAIGLIGEEGWQPWHRQQVRDVLSLVAAAEKQAGENGGPLQFERIVTEDGTPGAGIWCTVVRPTASMRRQSRTIARALRHTSVSSPVPHRSAL